MNREILFRGKRVDNDEWIYGYYFYDNQNKKRYITVGNNTYKISLCGEGSNYYQISAFEVISETVGRYTGLTDKNGTKIFEGDILSTGNSDEYFGVVEWIEENSGLAVSFNCLAETFEELILFDKVELEIIGNIHDNPELMEVSE